MKFLFPMFLSISPIPMKKRKKQRKKKEGKKREWEEGGTVYSFTEAVAVIAPGM